MNFQVAITAYDRPEFFSECVRTLNNAIGHYHNTANGQINVHVYIDKNDNAEEAKTVRDIADNICADNVSIICREKNIGGSKNNAMSIIDTYAKTLSDRIIYLESDIIISKTFFNFMKRCSKIMDDVSNIMQASTGNYDLNYSRYKDDEIIISQWPSSMGVMFNMRCMEFFVTGISEFNKDPNGFSAKFKHRLNPSMTALMFNGDTFFNHEWGGMLAITMAIGNSYIMHSSIPRSCHIGWHGWHLDKQYQISRGISRPEDHGQYVNEFSEDN